MYRHLGIRLIFHLRCIEILMLSAASLTYSWVSNKRACTLIYFEKFCSPARPYYIPARLLDFREIAGLHVYCNPARLLHSFSVKSVRKFMFYQRRFFCVYVCIHEIICDWIMLHVYWKVASMQTCLHLCMDACIRTCMHGHVCMYARM